jgi:tRNA G10  N-methylase Trm11
VATRRPVGFDNASIILPECAVRNVLRLRAADRRLDRPRESADELCFAPELVEVFLEKYTQVGDVVFDPFAGFGTALVVAERMQRRPLGLEILPERAEFIRSQLSDSSAVLMADARRLHQLDLPRIDFSISSPPYMTKVNHPQNPLSGYQSLDGDYPSYLRELTRIYGALAKRLTPGARVVINAANLREGPTPLAWDIAGAVSKVLSFEREIVIDWDRPEAWFTNDYCLLFRTA